MPLLEIRKLHVETNGKEIVKGLDLKVNRGEIHCIMGPNGAGKSTLAYAVMGHPNYKVTQGEILVEGKKINDLNPDERAKKGVFLAFQYPYEIAGVKIADFLRMAYQSVKKEKISVIEFYALLEKKMKLLGLDEGFSNRYLNEGFSGGEKKKCEILQLAVLEPKLAFLDETDSGLDIDALKIVATSIKKIASQNMGIVIITHYQRLLKYLKPKYVHIMLDGKIVKSGGYSISEKLEKKGYEWIKKGVTSAED